MAPAPLPPLLSQPMTNGDVYSVAYVSGELHRFVDVESVAVVDVEADHVARRCTTGPRPSGSAVARFRSECLRGGRDSRRRRARYWASSSSSGIRPCGLRCHDSTPSRANSVAIAAMDTIDARTPYFHSLLWLIAVSGWLLNGDGTECEGTLPRRHSTRWISTQSVTTAPPSSQRLLDQPARECPGETGTQHRR